MAKLVFVMPAPPNLANSRMHWRVKHRSKTTYWANLTYLLHAKQLPPIPKVPLDKFSITATFVLGGRMDADNLMARCKWPIDWLVTSGYLADDGPKHLVWTGIPTQEVSRKTPPTLTLTVEAL